MSIRSQPSQPQHVGEHSAPTIDFIVLAAGQSSRFQHSTPESSEFSQIRKPFLDLHGKSVLKHGLDSLMNWEHTGLIILVHPSDLNPQEYAHLEMLKQEYEDKFFLTTGGDERTVSVQNGFNFLTSQKPDSQFIGIHDSARPFISHQVLDRLYASLHASPKAGVLPVLPVADTLKKAGKDGQIETVDRRGLFKAQTPQCFPTALFASAISSFHTNFPDEKITDDCRFFELSGHPIHMVEGDNMLEKITHFADFEKLRKESLTMQHSHFETVHGTGYDVHRFDERKSGPIMICGVAVDYHIGLDAHSDGDVGLHALCDALFGAMSDGDIGSHFPPSEPQWKDKDSSHFLAYAVDRLKANGGSISQLDVTLICESPKIGPFRDKMRHRIAEICGIDIRRVSVKATTSERLGFTGRKEGLAAMASCTIQRLAFTDNLDT